MKEMQCSQAREPFACASDSEELRLMISDSMQLEPLILRPTYTHTTTQTIETILAVKMDKSGEDQCGVNLRNGESI